MRKFIPYREIGELDVLVVDGQHKRCDKLSHWAGANSDAEIAEDSSAGIVLNAIEKGHSALDHEMVSASHFDIDGFVGVWAVDNPEVALQNAHILKHMAKTGDFREFQADEKDADITLKLVAWMNKLEKEKFYAPFSVSTELSSCYDKFIYFIEHFDEAFNNINKCSNVWKEEYDRVLRDVEVMKSPVTKIENYNDIGLSVIYTPEPLHYYALTGQTVGNDIVLTIYDNNRYELEYKYTTWIDMASRTTFPRLRLDKLIADLNSIEKSNYKWHMDRLADSGPILRLIDSPIPKVIRYDQPYNRDIFTSSIESQLLLEKIVDFFKQQYEGITNKTRWTPSDMREINEPLSL